MKKHLILAILPVLMSCNKSKIFNGNDSLRGVAWFDNKVSQTKDSATGASITLKIYKRTVVEPGAFIKSERTEQFQVNSPTGEYNFDYVKTRKIDSIIGELNQSIPPTNKSLIYRGATKPGESLILKWIKRGSHLRLTVTDSMGNRLRNAQVCLYTNPRFLQQNGDSCVGSIWSSTTNANGVLFFADIDPAKYFFRVTWNYGAVALSNENPNSIDQTNDKIKTGTIYEETIPLFQGSN